MAILEMDQGLKKAGIGATNIRGRGDRNGSLVVVQGGPDMAEAVVTGTVMVASNAVAGATPGTALATTAPLSLWNPPGSGKNLVLMGINFGFVSGTLGAGYYAIAQTAQATLPGGTEVVPVCTLLGFPRGVGRAFTGANAVGAVPTIVRPSLSGGAFVGTTATLLSNCYDEIDGTIVLTPGNAVVISYIGGAGTSPLVVHAIKYWEVDA